MQTKNLLLVLLVIAFASCSTAYRTGQTPDDVYYSPEPTYDEYVSQRNQDDKDSYSYRNDEENDIRRGIRNPRYRSSVSINLGYGYSPYNSFGYAPYYGNSYGYNSFGYNPFGYNSFGYKNFNSPYGYNYYGGFHNPYSYYGGYYGNSFNGYYGNNSGYYNNYYPSIGTINTNRGVRRMNGVSNSYGTNNINSRNSNGYTPAPARTFPAQRQRQSSGVGNAIRRVFTPGNNSNSRSGNTRTFNNNQSNQNTPSRDLNTSSNPPSSSSGNNSGNAPARVFRK